MKRIAPFGLIALASMTAACTTFTRTGPETAHTATIPDVEPPKTRTAQDSTIIQTIPLPEEERATRIREIPAFGPEVRPSPIGDAEFPSFQNGNLSVILPPQTVPEFINTVFGELLGLGFTMGPGVAEKLEIVTYRSAPDISRTDLYESAANALKDYGLSVVYENGEVSVVQEAQLRRSAPRFIRSRARMSVPGNLRPVVQFVELYAVDIGEMNQILLTAFPDRAKLSVRANTNSNSLTISGLPEDVELAVSIIHQMDELRFADTRVATLRVQNWDVKEMAKVLETQLALEGFAITSIRGQTRAITLFPIEYTRQLVIFARDDEMLRYAIEAAERLDKDAELDQDVQARVYKVQHYEAKDLVEILEGQARSESDDQSSNPNSSPTGVDDDQDGNKLFSTDFVVDRQGNRLIYMATEQQDRNLKQLLRVLDTPQDEVLIEVTIAEVTLTDDTSYGMELLFEQLGSRGFAVGAGTSGGLGLTTQGLSGEYASGDYLVNFSALSKNNQINVLSTPRIVTKSGVSGSIQVGTDVPIITSQAASATQIGGTTDILQTVEYRETGIILDIEPLVLSEDRIDLQVSQEVSSAEANANQAIASPIISNRQITTELTLQDGQSAILGGLIENRYTRGTSGVPLIKDVPVLGNFFKTETLNASQTVLMVMITPYILSNRSDRRSSVLSLSNVVNQAFENQVNESVTLMKPREPFRIDVE